MIISSKKLLLTTTMGNQQGLIALSAAARNGSTADLETILEQYKTNEKRVEGLSVGHPDNITPLHKAAQNGFLSAVKVLCNAGSVIDRVDDYGHTPLYYAASSNRIDVVEYLVNERKAKLRIIYLKKDPMSLELIKTEKESPLHRACEKGHLKVATILVTAGADVNLSIHDSSLLFEETPLHRAALAGQEKIVQYLIRSGAKINAVDIDGNTALHKACYRDFVDVVIYLLTQGADLQLYNNNRERPAEMCMKGGAERTFHYLQRMTPGLLT